MSLKKVIKTVEKNYPENYPVSYPENLGNNFQAVPLTGHCGYREARTVIYI